MFSRGGGQVGHVQALYSTAGQGLQWVDPQLGEHKVFAARDAKGLAKDIPPGVAMSAVVLDPRGRVVSPDEWATTKVPVHEALLDAPLNHEFGATGLGDQPDESFLDLSPEPGGVRPDESFLDLSGSSTRGPLLVGGGADPSFLSFSPESSGGDGLPSVGGSSPEPGSPVGSSGDDVDHAGNDDIASSVSGQGPDHLNAGPGPRSAHDVQEAEGVDVDDWRNDLAGHVDLGEVGSRAPTPDRVPSAQIGPPIDPADIHGVNPSAENRDGALKYRRDRKPLYRFDRRPPEVVFRHGFTPPNPTDLNLGEHIQSGNSGFISTTRDPNFDILAPTAALGIRVYRYRIDAPGGIDINATFGGGGHTHEAEVVFAGGIRTENISGVEEILTAVERSADEGPLRPGARWNVTYGEFVENRHFDPNMPNDGTTPPLGGQNESGAHPSAHQPPSSIPPFVRPGPNPTALKGAGQGVGSHGARLFKDPATDELWLIKAPDQGDEFVSAVQEATARLQIAVGIQAPETYVFLQGKVSAQRWLADSQPLDTANLSAQDLVTLQKHHVLDWLISNHDAHQKQFLRMPDSTIVGIDKDQAFRYFGRDRLDWDFHPNAVIGEFESELDPVYNTLWRDFHEGTRQLSDPRSGELAEFITQVQAIPDHDIRELFRPYATGAAASGKLATSDEDEDDEKLGLGPQRLPSNDVESFLSAIVQRKNNLATDFAALYDRATGTLPPLSTDVDTHVPDSAPSTPHPRSDGMALLPPLPDEQRAAWSADLDELAVHSDRTTTGNARPEDITAGRLEAWDRYFDAFNAHRTALSLGGPATVSTEQELTAARDQLGDWGLDPDSLTEVYRAGAGEDRVTLEDGSRRFGRYGGAGVLLRTQNPDGSWSVLMQRRAGETHRNAWGLPGGARQLHETAAQAAFRELREETGIGRNGLTVRAQNVTDTAPARGFDWTYTTLIADAPHQLPTRIDDESLELRWVPESEVGDLSPLHPGFAASWPRLQTAMADHPPTVGAQHAQSAVTDAAHAGDAGTGHADAPGGTEKLSTTGENGPIPSLPGRDGVVNRAGGAGVREEVGIEHRGALSLSELDDLMDEAPRLTPSRDVPGELTEVQCELLAEWLIGAFHPDGVRGVTVDDSAVGRGGVAGAQGRVLAGGRWGRVRDLSALVGAVGGQPGSSAVVMFSRGGGQVGHVQALYSAAGRVWWVDPQRPAERVFEAGVGGVAGLDDLPPAVEMRAVVIDPQGRIVKPGGWSTADISDTEAGLDAPLNHEFGAHGEEIEFYAVALHAADGTALPVKGHIATSVDGLVKVSTDLRMVFVDHDGNYHTDAPPGVDPDEVGYWDVLTVPELVTVPGRSLDHDVTQTSLAAIKARRTDLIRRLQEAASSGHRAPLDDVLGPEYRIEEGYQDVRVESYPVRVPEAPMHFQLTEDVPLAGIHPFLVHLAENSRPGGGLDDLRMGIRFGRQVAAIVAAHLKEQRDVDFGRKDAAALAGEDLDMLLDPTARAVMGVAALAYVMDAGYATKHTTDDDRKVTKDYMWVVPRVPMRGLAEALGGDVQEILAHRANEIHELFESDFRSDHPDFPDDGPLREMKIDPRDSTNPLGFVLDSVLNSRQPLPEGHRDELRRFGITAVGSKPTPRDDGGLPLVPLEARNSGKPRYDHPVLGFYSDHQMLQSAADQLIETTRNIDRDVSVAHTVHRDPLGKAVFDALTDRVIGQRDNEMNPLRTAIAHYLVENPGMTTALKRLLAAASRRIGVELVPWDAAIGFVEEAKAPLDRGQEDQIREFAAVVVGEAQRRQSDGGHSLVVHVEGGGNGRNFNRSRALGVGQTRADITREKLQEEVGKLLDERKLPGGIVEFRNAESRGRALPEGVVVSFDKKTDAAARRMVVVRIEDGHDLRTDPVLPEPGDHRDSADAAPGQDSDAARGDQSRGTGGAPRTDSDAEASEGERPPQEPVGAQAETSTDNGYGGVDESDSSDSASESDSNEDAGSIDFDPNRMVRHQTRSAVTGSAQQRGAVGRTPEGQLAEGIAGADSRPHSDLSVARPVVGRGDDEIRSDSAPVESRRSDVEVDFDDLYLSRAEYEAKHPDDRVEDRSVGDVRGVDAEALHDPAADSVTTEQDDRPLDSVEADETESTGPSVDSVTSDALPDDATLVDAALRSRTLVEAQRHVEAMEDQFTRAESRRNAALGALNLADRQLNSATASDPLAPEAKRTAEQKLVAAAASHRDARRELDAARQSLAAAERRQADVQRALRDSTRTGSGPGPADLRGANSHCSNPASVGEQAACC